MKIEDMVLLIDSLRNRTDCEESTIHAVVMDLHVHPNGIKSKNTKSKEKDINDAFVLANRVKHTRGFYL